MKVSPEKSAANRRNALKSTGPKTSQGRSISSKNALRHGLSVPLPQELVGPLQQEVAQLIMHDGIDADAARELAEKIIDYERNLLYLREDCLNEADSGASGSKGIEVANPSQVGRNEKIEEILVSLQRVSLGGMSREEREEIKLLGQMCKFIIRTEKKLNKTKDISVLRYFKRSSNQLIKALRQLNRI